MWMSKENNDETGDDETGDESEAEKGRSHAMWMSKEN